jgi:hypothetical protein
MSSALFSTEGSSVAPATTKSSTTTRRRPYLAPVPDCEPPFDDERSAASRLQQLRSIAKARTGTAPTASQPARVPHTVGDPAVPGWSQEADMGVRRTATAQLPPATRTGPVLARALVEVVSGQRPLSQLRVHCAPEVFAGMQRRPIAHGPLGHLLNVRVCEPADGAAEISVVFRRGERVRAMAFRIQGVDGRWRITALQTG